MPNNPQKINPEKLKDQAYLEQIKKTANDFIERGLALESAKLADQIEEDIKTYPQLNSQAPGIFRVYQKLIILLKWTGLTLYDDQTVLELFRNHFLDALEAGLDLNGPMTLKMYSVPDLVWSEVAQELLGALKHNNQRIGQRSIGEWLKDYDKTYGIEKHSTLEQSEYLTQNPNVRTLIEEERDKLKQLIRFYDNLKPLSLSKIEQAIRQFAPELLKEAGPVEKVERPLPERLAEPPTTPIAPPPERETQKDIYREPVPASSRPKEPSQVEPKIEGNIVNLKGE